MMMMIENIIINEKQPKFRKISTTSNGFKPLLELEGSMGVLQEAGFEKTKTHLILPDNADLSKCKQLRHFIVQSYLERKNSKLVSPLHQIWKEIYQNNLFLSDWWRKREEEKYFLICGRYLNNFILFYFILFYFIYFL